MYTNCYDLACVELYTVQTSGKVNIFHELSAGVLHPAHGYYAGDPRCPRPRAPASDGNQFMGVVELPKGAIIELEFSIDK